MKITQIANACCIYESAGYKILCDPWLTPGAFYGSWFHSRPLVTKPKDVADYDLLYISHLHPDHYDPATLAFFDKSKPVVILARKTNYLKRMLERDGFTNIVEMEHEEKREFGPFTLTMFEPFCGHPFADTEIGNPIDSAIIVEDDVYTVLNANDNTLTHAWATHFRTDRRVFIDVAQLNYNNAGPYPACFTNYPACFTNLSEQERLVEAQRLLKRNLEHVVEICRILKPRYFMPFAGDYLIGGRNYSMNRYLGTTTPEHAAGYVTMAIPTQETLVLRERETFDLGADMIKVSEKFPYAYKSVHVPTDANMSHLIAKATERLKEKQRELNCYPDCVVIVNEYEINLTKNGFTHNVLKATVPPQLLYWILIRNAHWNNAEIGCHITFERTPNVYLPDVHLLMSYFHA